MNPKNRAQHATAEPAFNLPRYVGRVTRGCRPRCSLSLAAQSTFARNRHGELCARRAMGWGGISLRAGARAASYPPFRMEKLPFDQLGLSPDIQKAVAKMGFEEASPIQTAVI